MIERHIREYKGNFDFRRTKHITQEICGIQVSIDVMAYCDGYNHRRKADVTLKKGEFEYSCECVDYHDWDNMFYPVTLEEKTYFCFRKTLYGFTFLDPETLTEKYDYFPERVQRDEESFIFDDVKQIGDIIVFDGCYWADACMYFAYDHSKKRFLNLSEEFEVFANDGESRVESDTLILTGTDKNWEYNEVTITREELYRLIDGKGVFEF